VHELRAGARDHFEYRRPLVVQRQQSATTRFWLERGWQSEPYVSPAIQSGLVLFPDGSDTVIAHNELSRLIFLSSATGQIRSSIPTPAGNVSAFREFDMGGETGRVILSGYDAPRDGINLLAVRARLPAEPIWHWQGPATAFEKPDGVVLARVARKAAPTAVAVAGRTGRSM
jgi:hypothetical protein